MLKLCSSLFLLSAPSAPPPAQGSEGKGDAKGKKTSNKPLKILEEDDEDLSALRDPSEKVGGVEWEVMASGGTTPPTTPRGRGPERLAG